MQACKRACMVSYNCRIFLYGREFCASCTCCVNTKKVSAGCGRCLSYRPILSLRVQLDTDLMISQAKVTCQHSVKFVALKNGVGMSVILLENSPLNDVRESRNYKLNYQIDVQICSQFAWDNH
ncbi:hypothetical protein TNCV_2580571 [Trichonephila clavipes]|uniref:Uncharacterized protein n=1 Tax=Trichonephila clavipes TaxID=2585209 RepID=A0A8X6SB68_TRICX|nr:hypothetical protein TNCV_2580571 [Trichonephila clavipes]